MIRSENVWSLRLEPAILAHLSEEISIENYEKNTHRDPQQCFSQSLLTAKKTLLYVTVCGAKNLIIRTLSSHCLSLYTLS